MLAAASCFLGETSGANPESNFPMGNNDLEQQASLIAPAFDQGITKINFGDF